MMELFVSLLLFTSSPALGAPVTFEMTTASPITTSAPDYQASTETHIEETSSNSPVDLDQVSSTSDYSASSSTPSPVALPPRFKYMEEQLTHKKEDLEEVEQPEASSVVTSTIGPTTEHPTTVEETSISPDSTTFPIPPRFKYMEEQLTHKKENLEEVEQPEASSVVTSTIGPTTEHLTTIEETSISPDSSTFPIPPLFKYMEEQLAIQKQDLLQEVDSESSSIAPSTIAPTVKEETTEFNTDEISTSSKGSATFSLPPRFKYMEEQLAHKKQDLEEEENFEASKPSTSTRAPTTEDQSTVVTPEESSTSPESTTFPIQPRFKYMEAEISNQESAEEEKFEATTSYPISPPPTTSPTTIYTESSTTPSSTTLSSQTTHYREQEEVLKDSVDLSEKVPTFSGGFLPGPAGFVRKTKKISEEVKQEMMKEMEVKYGPVIDDIQEFGYILKRKNDELSAEVKSLREKLIKTESELIDAKLVKQMRWMPFWNY